MNPCRLGLQIHIHLYSPEDFIMFYLSVMLESMYSRAYIFGILNQHPWYHTR